MSEYFQPGQHPDADLLSAFADDALPAHERRQTMLHLAQCADCRSVVFLAQEAAVEDAPAPVLQLPPSRKRWFSAWTLTSTAAGVLACLILAAVYGPHFFSRGDEVALNSSAPVPESPSPPQPASRSELPPSTSGGASSIASGQGALPNSSSALDRKTIQALPASGRDTAGMNQQSQARVRAAGNDVAGGSAAPKEIDANAPASLAGGIGAGQGVGVAGPLAGKAKNSAAAPKPELSRNAFAHAAPSAAISPAPTAHATQSAPAPVLHANYGPAQDSNQVNDLATISAQVIVSDASLKRTPIAQQQFNLPSRLETVSAISDGRLILAVDSAGKLFASKDAGRRWKAISPHWTGRAVKVDFESTPAEKKVESPVGAAMPAVVAHVTPPPMAPTAAGAVSQRLPRLASAAGNALLTGVVTDRTGAAVPKASVTIRNMNSAQSIIAKTDEAGKYSVQNLAPGTYTVTAQSPGFKTQNLSGIQVAGSEPIIKNIALDIGSVSEAVSVQADSVAMQTETPEVGATIESQKMAIPQPTVFELSTDTGEVWISTDGRHWKRK